jgi:hypothetical protein
MLHIVVFLTKKYQKLVWLSSYHALVFYDFIYFWLLDDWHLNDWGLHRRRLHVRERGRLLAVALARQVWKTSSRFATVSKWHESFGGLRKNIFISFTSSRFATVSKWNESFGRLRKNTLLVFNFWQSRLV